MAPIFLSAMGDKLKRWIQSTVGLTGKEANAFLILLPTLFLVIFSEPLYRWLAHDNTSLSIKETIYLDSLVDTIEKPAAEATIKELTLFNFDPNKTTVDDFVSLGISNTVAKRIVQYRTKGGVFRIKSDLAKMYGLDSALYKTLSPYITLPDKLERERESVSNDKQKKIINYDINTADTSDLKSVRGIGSVLAKRILKYRESLGGFIEAKQLTEVYGLDSLVLEELGKFHVADGFVPRKIIINQTTERELDDHPYLSLRDARAIITYRVQHGSYKSIDNLLAIKTLKENTIRKVAPYLSFE